MSLKQQATITKIENGKIYLTICTPDTCEACKAQAACASMGGGKEVVLYEDGIKREVGDQVILSIKQSQGVKAVLLAYLVPVILIVGLLFGLQGVIASELTLGAIVLGAVVLYYVGLRVFRKKIESELTIEIE